MRNKTQIYLEFLVIKSKQGDSNALEELIQYWHPRLLRHAWRLIYNKDVLEDIIQEVWIAVVKGIRNLEDPACFRSWIYKIVTFKCTDWLRRKKRVKEQTVDNFINEPKINQDSSSNQDEINLLRKAISQLSKDHQIIVSLFYLDEMSIKEIAQILCIPKGTIKSRLYHARQELKDKLKGHM